MNKRGRFIRTEEHNRKLGLALMGDKNPSKCPAVREKIRQSALRNMAARDRGELVEYKRKPSDWIRYRWRRSKNTARKKGIEFTLTFDEYKILIKDSCFYCHGVFGAVKTSVGLDRVNNLLGYLSGNCVSCCQVCNRIKADCFSKEETKVMVEALLEHRSKQKVA